MGSERLKYSKRFLGGGLTYIGLNGTLEECNSVSSGGDLHMYGFLIFNSE